VLPFYSDNKFYVIFDLSPFTHSTSMPACTSPHVQITCKYSIGMMEDVAVVMASASFILLCDSDEEENDEQHRPPTRHRLFLSSS